MKRDHPEAYGARALLFALLAVTVAPVDTAGGAGLPLQPNAAFHLAAADAAPARPAQSSAETRSGAARAPAHIGNADRPAAPAPRALNPVAVEPAGVAATPGAAIAVPPFRSALDGYRRYRADEPLRPWRELNDEVGTVGGHAGALGPTRGEASGGDVREHPE